MKNKTKVYIVNKGGHDHSDAERFGELVYLSIGSINRYATSSIYRKFSLILKDSTKDDYILPTGLSIMTSIACAIFARIHGRLNLLLYRSSRTKETKPYYIERVIMIDGLIENNKEKQNDSAD